MYICDAQTCKAFQIAGEAGATGSQAYTLQLLNEFFNDGIWALPCIGAAILAPLSLWFMRVPITVLNFAILFFVSFAIMYFIIGFLIHHYARPIIEYLEGYVSTSCTGATVALLDSDSQPDLIIFDEHDAVSESVCSSDIQIYDSEHHVTFSDIIE